MHAQQGLAGVKGAKVKHSKKGKQSFMIEPNGQISADNSLAVYNFVRAGAAIAIVTHSSTLLADYCCPSVDLTICN